MKESKYLKDTMQNVEKLLTIPLMKEFKSKALGNILKQSKICQYDDGETIIREGDVSPLLYFLLSGEVRVMKDGEDLATLKRKGDVFGEMSMLTDSHRSASATAVGETTCLAVDSSLINNFSEHDKLAFCCILYRVLAEVVTERLKKTSADIIRLKKENEELKARLGV
ncbi:MAG: cyclic nucleotide-binding domain-containing protein [Thermodesulfobacteriota bacterium]